MIIFVPPLQPMVCESRQRSAAGSHYSIYRRRAESMHWSGRMARDARDHRLPSLCIGVRLPGTGERLYGCNATARGRARGEDDQATVGLRRSVRSAIAASDTSASALGGTSKDYPLDHWSSASPP